MKSHIIHLDIMPLQTALNISFRHAQAKRSRGESIWVKASRNGTRGFGEGCPRTYVAGDDLESSLSWARDTFWPGHPACNSYEGMDRWSRDHEDLIRRYPSAWCAVEMALLDLFARETEQSVESLLGLKPFRRKSKYSAVLGVDSSSMFEFLADQYLIRNMTDIKIKLNGDLAKDQERIDCVRSLAQRYGDHPVRIRLDANNLWSGRTDEAITHVKALQGDLFAVEEPVRAGDPEANIRFNRETGLPVILDESLLCAEDLALYPDGPDSFIANIKISRVGGLTRAVSLISALREKSWPVIVGCHVGESSLLTRAGLIAASAAGENLTAHEGAFGDFLLSREPVKPMLRFNGNGELDLEASYLFEDSDGRHTVSPENWNLGLGMVEVRRS